jgi:hypothetical protein
MLPRLLGLLHNAHEHTGQIFNLFNITAISIFNWPTAQPYAAGVLSGLRHRADL